MKIIKNHRKISESEKGAIVAVGNFDGIHNGHKALINNIISLSKIKGKKRGICNFNPHPKNFLAKGQQIKRVQPQDLNYEILKK